MEHHLKRTLMALAMFLIAAPAMAQVDWTTQQMGSTQFIDDTQTGTNWSGTGQQLGNTYFQDFHNTQGQMLHCTTSSIGSATFTSCY
jgi:hypothetical protein